jgi:hypothetical protein
LIVARQHAANCDDWTTGSTLAWGACLGEGTDPKQAYARTLGFQAHPRDGRLRLGRGVAAWAADTCLVPGRSHALEVTAAG